MNKKMILKSINISTSELPEKLDEFISFFQTKYSELPKGVETYVSVFDDEITIDYSVEETDSELITRKRNEYLEEERIKRQDLVELERLKIKYGETK
jgi:hypothetical protein